MNKIGFISILALVSILVVSGCIGQQSNSTSNVNPVQQISTLSKPGVVLIFTNITGTVTLPGAELNEQGRLVPGQGTYTRQAGITATGSGFIVSTDGYILTNAHVVYFEEPLLKYYMLQTVAEQEIQEFKEAAKREPTKEERDILVNYVLEYGKVSDTKTAANIWLGVPVSGVGKLTLQFPVDIKKIGTPAPGKDVAILKINQKNLPTVKLGDSDKVQVGDKVYPMGYPGVATFHPYLSEESITEPTLTSGIISAEKQVPAGFTALQTDASITHGNSGGPVFNEQGQVIGIATFGSIDFKTGQEIAGFNFIIPINIAKEFMKELNIQNIQGPVDEHYAAGMFSYWKGDYSKAIEEFNVVRNLYPGHPYVNDFVTKAQEKLLTK